MKILFLLLLSVAIGKAAELQLPDRMFYYDAEMWKPTGDGKSRDVWPFVDRELLSSSGILRLELGPHKRLEQAQIMELIGSDFDQIKREDEIGDCVLYRFSKERGPSQRLLGYYTVGSFAYFVFVDAEAEFMERHKVAFQKFITGLRGKEKK